MHHSSIACRNCAQLKISCDKALPCQPCVRRRVACIPRVSRRRSAVIRRDRPSQRHSGEDSDTRYEDIDVNDAEHEGSLINDPLLHSSGHGRNPAQGPLTPMSMLPPFPSDSDMSGIDLMSTAPSETSFDLMNYSTRTWDLTTDAVARDAAMFMDAEAPHFPPSSSAWPPSAGTSASPSEQLLKRRSNDNVRSTEASTQALRSQAIGPPKTFEEDSERHWSFFQCNPTSSRLSSTSFVRHSLEALSVNEDDPLIPGLARQLDQMRCTISIEPFRTPTRDRLLALTYCFSEKARKLHRVAPLSSAEPSLSHQGWGDEDTVVTLPSSEVLEHFLSAYVLRFEYSYPSIAASFLSPNDLMRDSPKLGALLLLLMAALGSTSYRTNSVSNVSTALTEACRVRLNELFEKQQSFQPASLLLFLRSALLFTLLGAWR